MINFIVSLLIGGISGYLTGKILKFKKGLFTTVLLGIAGGYIGPFLLNSIGFDFSNGIISRIICSTIGAIIIVLAAKLTLKSTD